MARQRLAELRAVSPLRRGFLVVALEVGTEDGELGEASATGNGADLEVGRGQESGGEFEAEPHFESGEGTVGREVEDAGEGASVTVGVAGELFGVEVGDLGIGELRDEGEESV